MKIDIFSGFLGAGKTTLIKKLLKEAYAGEKVVLIENEFGEIGIDGGFLKEAGVNITEMNSGCICCSLVGDFAEALKKVAKEYAPDRILIEPSGVGKLSDVVKAVKNASVEGATLNAACVVVDACKCKMYMKNFGEFFFDQVENAGCIVLSHTAKASETRLQEAIALLRERNENAAMVTANWDDLDGKVILAAIEKRDTLEKALYDLTHETAHHHEHHHDHGEHCTCGCHDHHEHHHDECCHHHEHDHHERHHDHGEHCTCGCHDHDHHEHHHGHHHADEVFVSWGVETAKKFTVAEVETALCELQDAEKYGMVLRAKGIVAGEGKWVHFDYVPEEADVREGGAGVIGRLCVIGCKLNEENLKALFKV
ncbi:MAG: GTP-binding protein [Clostridia bacterium]|nr:GTP-binding protein [Clostridia bacterium]